MQKNRLTLFGSVSMLAIALPAHAQEVFDLDEITVFYNQVPTEVARTGVSVEIVGEEELEKSSYASAADTLSRLPGVTTSTNGGLGKQTNLRIRGLSDRYIGVRIDGIDVVDPSSTQTPFNWGSLTPSGLSRVGVLKGSQSALYGSEAIGGVVSITTKQAPDDIGTVFSFGLEVATYDTVRGDIAFTYARIDTDGFSAEDENDGKTEDDGFESDQFFLSGGYELTETIRVGADMIYLDSETNIDNFGGEGCDADRPFFTERRGARVYAEIDGGAVDHLIEATYFEAERRDPDTPFGSLDFESDRTELRYCGVTEIQDTTLSFGAEYSEETAEFSNGDADYDVFSIFGEALYAVNENLDLPGALRVDNTSEFGTEPTGRLALAWRPQSGTIVRASLGMGFRALSLNEPFGPFNFGDPNPDLDPKESISAEFGVEHVHDTGTRVQATAFWSKIDDLIQYPVDGYEQVDSTSRARSVELAASTPLTERATLFRKYTYTTQKMLTVNSFYGCRGMTCLSVLPLC